MDIETILFMYEDDYNPGPRPMAQGGRIGFQDGSVEGFVEIVKSMVADPEYMSPININAKEVGRIPNFEAAKKIVKEEMGEASFNEAYQKNINRSRKVRAKEKRKVDPELREKYLAGKAERRRKRRVEKIGDKTKLTPNEKYLNFQQSLITKQLNEKVKKNPDIILKNNKLMDELSTTVDKNGNIIKRKVNLSDITNRGVFEIEHQRDIYKKGAMKDFPYNRNLILGPHNRTDGFKATAEKFIEKNPKDPKVNNLIKKAEELKITLQPDVPQGTFKTKSLGYKQIANPVEKFTDVAKLTVPNISKNLGLSAYNKNLSKAQAGLGMKLSSNPFFDPSLMGKVIGDLGKGINVGLGPTGILALNSYLGVDPTQSIDRAGLGLEAALAKPLVKGATSVTDQVKNPMLRKIAERAALAGMSPAMAIKVASRLSPVGIASLAGEAVYNVGKLGYEDQKRFDALSPEEQAAERAEQEKFAFDIEGS